MKYWDTDVVMLFLSSEERDVFWGNKLNYSYSFDEQVKHYFETLNIMLDNYGSQNNKKRSSVGWWLKNNYNIFMYGIGRELIVSHEDIISKDKYICDLIHSVHDKYVKYKDDINIDIGDVHELINYKIDEGLENNDASLKVEKLKERLEQNIYSSRKKRSVDNYLDKFVVKTEDAISIHEEFIKKERKPEIIYDYLEGEGSKYAVTANGLIKDKSLSGKIANNFIIKKLEEIGVIEVKEILNNIKADLAEDTILAFISRGGRDGYIRGDLTSQEEQIIHYNVLNRNGISTYGWTLTIPYQIIPEHRHEEIHYEMLKSAGNDQAELEFAIYLSDEMLLEIIKNPKKESINAFIDWVKTLSTIDNIKETGSVFGEYLAERGTTATEYITAKVRELREVIPKSDLDFSGGANLSSDKKAPVISGGIMPASHPLENMPSMKNLHNPSNTSQSTELNFSGHDVSSSFLEGRIQSNHHLENMPSMRNLSNSSNMSHSTEFNFSGYDVSSSFLEGRIQSNHHLENMLGNLSENMSSMDPFDSTSNNYFSDRTASNIPSRFSGYSSNSFFS